MTGVRDLEDLPRHCWEGWRFAPSVARLLARPAAFLLQLPGMPISRSSLVYVAASSIADKSGIPIGRLPPLPRKRASTTPEP